MLQCFEGMKAYKDAEGHVRLFRPEMNMARLNKSSARLGMPVSLLRSQSLICIAMTNDCNEIQTFDPEELIKVITEFLRIEERWIPSKRGYSLYLRPTIIGTQDALGVRAPDRALLFVIASPVGPYFSTGFKAVSLLADTEHVRAWPKGTGDFKVGGNYAPCVLPQSIAASKGYQQNLWLFGEEHYVTEVGTMNFFMLWSNSETGRRELITPALNGLILPGVTRNTVIDLVKSWEAETGIAVREGTVTMPEIVQAVEENRVIEMFGAGTACIVSPIKRIGYKGEDILIPTDPNGESEAGPLTQKVFIYSLSFTKSDLLT